MRGVDFHRRGLRPAIAALAAAAVTACGPVYRDFKVYDPPTDLQGQQCVAAAQERRSVCETENSAAYNQCLAEQTTIAKVNYDAALAAYEGDLAEFERCRAADDGYEQELAAWQTRQDRYMASLRNPAAGIAPNPGPRPTRTVQFCPKPSRPELNDFVDRSVCQTPKSACGEVYDSLYKACGGSVMIETRCVSNCD